MEIISLRIRTADEAYGRVLQTVLKRNYPGFMIQLESLPDVKTGAAEAGCEASAQPAGAQTGSWGIDLSLCDDRSQLQDGRSCRTGRSCFRSCRPQRKRGLRVCSNTRRRTK